MILALPSWKQLGRFRGARVALVLLLLLVIGLVVDFLVRSPLSLFSGAGDVLCGIQTSSPSITFPRDMKRRVPTIKPPHLWLYSCDGSDDNVAEVYMFLGRTCMVIKHSPDYSADVEDERSQYAETPSASARRWVQSELDTLQRGGWSTCLNDLEETIRSKDLVRQEWDCVSGCTTTSERWVLRRGDVFRILRLDAWPAETVYLTGEGQRFPIHFSSNGSLSTSQHPFGRPLMSADEACDGGEYSLTPLLWFN